MLTIKRPGSTIIPVSPGLTFFQISLIGPSVSTSTVIDVKDNKKSRNPAYVVTIDFGSELGIKKSSAQITTLYKPEDLIGTQVICCVNLTPIHIGSVKSEVRILGTKSKQGVVLLRPAELVKNGDKVF